MLTETVETLPKTTIGSEILETGSDALIIPMPIKENFFYWLLLVLAKYSFWKFLHLCLMAIIFFPVHPKEISLHGGSEKREGGMGGACYICPDNSNANKRNGPG